jgi:hypothetical protein
VRLQSQFAYACTQGEFMAPGFIASFDDFILFQQVKFAYKNFADESKSILFIILAFNDAATYN